jgi:hypothetical protein
LQIGERQSLITGDRKRRGLRILGGLQEDGRDFCLGISPNAHGASKIAALGILNTTIEMVVAEARQELTCRYALARPTTRVVGITQHPSLRSN